MHVLCRCDLCVNFLTAYHDPNSSELITAPSKIAKQYLRSWFLVDVVAVFPMDYTVLGAKVRHACVGTALHHIALTAPPCGHLDVDA